MTVNERIICMLSIACIMRNLVTISKTKRPPNCGPSRFWVPAPRVEHHLASPQIEPLQLKTYRAPTPPRNLVTASKTKRPPNWGPFCFWCRHQESNSGPTDYKSVALPTELCRLIVSLVAARGALFAFRACLTSPIRHQSVIIEGKWRPLSTRLFPRRTSRR